MVFSSLEATYTVLLVGAFLFREDYSSIIGSLETLLEYSTW